MKFWSEMSEVTKSEIKANDKLLIGKASDKTTRYTNVSSLPFAQKTDLIGNIFDSYALATVAVTEINPSITNWNKPYVKYEESLSNWMFHYKDLAQILPAGATVLNTTTGKTFSLETSGISKVLSESLSPAEIAKTNIGSVTNQMATSFIVVDSVVNPPADSNKSSLIYDMSKSMWTYRSVNEGTIQSIELSDLKNDFITYASEENKFYRCSPGSSEKEEILIGEGSTGGGSTLKNTIQLQSTRMSSYDSATLRTLISTERTFSNLLSTELQKVKIGDNVAIPCMVSDMVDKTAQLVLEVKSINTDGKSLTGKILTYSILEKEFDTGVKSIRPTSKTDGMFVSMAEDNNGNIFFCGATSIYTEYGYIILNQKNLRRQISILYITP